MDTNAADITQNPAIPVDADAYSKAMNTLKPNSSAFDEFKATADSTVDSTIVGSLARMYMMSDAKQRAADMGSQKVGVEDLNRQYPGLPSPFKEPTDPFTAGEIARRQVDRKQMEDTIANGPQGPLYAVGRFGAGLFAHAGDPLEIGAAMATGFATEAALGATAIGTKLGIGLVDAAGKKVAQTLAQRAATGFIEGSAASATLEPANWIANKQENIVNSKASSAFNILLGGLTYGIIKAGAPVVTSSISKGWGNLVESLNENQAEMTHNYVASRLSQDKVPDPSPLFNDFAQEKAGKGPKTDEPPYIFKRQADMEKVGEGKFYIPKETAESSFMEGKRPKIGGDFGSGLYATDNPNVANGIAAAKTLDTPGSVHEVSLGDTHLVKMDELPTGKVLKAQQAFLDKFTETRGGTGYYPEAQGVDGARLTPRDVIETLKEGIDRGEFHPQVLEDYYNEFRKIGRDGFHYEVHETGGLAHDPYNAAYLFDHDSDKITQSGVVDSNPARVADPKIPEVEALGKDAMSHNSDLWHDPQAEAEFQKHINEGIPEVNQEAFENRYKEARQELEEQLKQAPSAEDQAKLDAIDEVAKRGAQMEKLAKATMACFGRSG